MFTNLILLLYCWINFETMIFRRGDSINVISDLSDFEDIGEISFEEAEFMPILVFKKSLYFSTFDVLEDNILNYFNMFARL